MAQMDPVSAGGFASAAGHYARSRPGYARAAVGAIAAELDRGTVLDVGAGTGILSGQLERAGCTVIGLEPLAEMLSQLRRSLPRVPAVRGVAEALSFASDTFAGVTIAQAFHWMDHNSVLREAHRVLAPGGVLALVWNVRDESVGWVRELTDLVERRSGGRPYTDHRERDWEQVVAHHGGFEHLGSERHTNPVASSAELVVERIRSTSFVAVMEPAARERLVAEVRELLDGDPRTSDRSGFEYPHDTVLHMWRVRSG